MSNITCIMASDKYGTIGKERGLPWKINEEIELFKNTISGYPLIMGRITYECAPQYIRDGKDNLILSKNKLNDERFITSVSDLANSLIHPKYFFIGGATAAESLIQAGIINDFLLSIIDGKYDGDTKLNLDLIYSRFHCIKEEKHKDFTRMFLRMQE